MTIDVKKLTKKEMKELGKAQQEYYKTIVQHFIDSQDEGGFVSAMLLGLVAEIIRRTYRAIEENFKDGQTIDNTTKHALCGLIARENLELLQQLTGLSDEQN